MPLLEKIKRIFHNVSPSFVTLLEDRLEIRKEIRNIHGKGVDATYDAEIGNILIWGGLEADEIDLIIILMHEIGHLLFHEILSDKERKNWLRIHSEEPLDFALEEDYPRAFIPEETFCCICSILGVIFWLERKDMKDKADKTRKKLNTNAPQSYAFAHNVLTNKDKIPSINESNDPSKELYHSTVKKIRNWIEEKTGPLK